MTRTIAEALRDEGRLEGRREESVLARQQTLVRQLRLRFKRVPRPIEQVIRSADDVARLDAWLDGVVTAKTLDAVGIPLEQAP